MQLVVPEPRPKNGVSRRTLVKGVAWTVPAVSMAAAVPAFAASPNDFIVTGTGWSSVPRCEVISDTSFCAAPRDGSPTQAGLTVEVTLPAGLQFGDGGTTQSLTTNARGCVTVPGFRVTGAGGDYSGAITGKVEGAGPDSVGHLGGSVSVGDGVVIELRANFVDSGGTSAAVAVRSTGQLASAGASSGNDVGNSLSAAVIRGGTNDGRVQYWHGTSSWANGSTPTRSTLGTVQGATMVDTYTINGSEGRTGGVAANASQLWQWHAAFDGSNPTVRPVTLPTGFGTILEIAAFPTRCYARTTAGIYSWPTDRNGTVTTALALTAPNHRIYNGSTLGWSPYYDTRNDANLNNDATGVAYIRTDGQLSLRTYPVGIPAATGNGNPTDTTNVASGVVDVAAGSAGLMALTSTGAMHTYAAYGSPADSNSRIRPTGWTQRATNVSSITAWGINGYFGGLYLQNGTVTQVFGHGSYTTRAIGGLEGQTITQIFSSDGAYLVLTSSGEVWYWFGNNDHAGSLTARRLATTGAVADLGVWANHAGTRYYAGAYAIEAAC